MLDVRVHVHQARQAGAEPVHGVLLAHDGIPAFADLDDAVVLHADRAVLQHAAPIRVDQSVTEQQVITGGGGPG